MDVFYSSLYIYHNEPKCCNLKVIRSFNYVFMAFFTAVQLMSFITDLQVYARLEFTAYYNKKYDILLINMLTMLQQ